MAGPRLPAHPLQLLSFSIITAQQGTHRWIQAKGKLRGKKPKLSRKQEAHLIELHATGKYSKQDLAELFAVGRSTIYRAIARAEHKATSRADF